MAIGNIDNDDTQPPNDKIVTGSFSGILRVHSPTSRDGYEPTDLLVEQQLNSPILQVEIGRFIPNSKDIAIAVLMPRRLSVFSLNCTTSNNELGGSNVEGGSDSLRNYELVEQYSHDLERLAFNFCCGPFGGVYNKDYICIQSFDGQLAFYEQDRFGFAVFLANFLVPGPIRYFRPLDAFLTYSSEMLIECYRYQNLKASMGSWEKDSEQGGKKVQVSWSVNVGEEVYDIAIARYSRYLSAAQNEIIVLGERTLFTIKDNGTISSQKRLDYFPACMDIFQNADDQSRNAKHKLLICTHNKSLHIYKDPKLIWAAGTSTVPCQVRVGRFCDLDGMIVMLNDTGTLSINYLGTDPATNPVPIMQTKEFNYVEIEAEHRKLQSIIRKARQANRSEPSEKLIIKAQVPKNLDKLQQSYSGNEDVVRRITIKLYISYSGTQTLEDVSLSVHLPEPFTSIHKTIDITSLNGGPNRTPVIVPLMVMIPSGQNKRSPTTVPHILDAQIVGIYRGLNGEPRTTTCEFRLPLILAGQIVPERKTNTTHKVLVQTNQPPPPMEQLFGDCIDSENTSQLGGIVTFKYVNGDDCTILVSKNPGRYRVQSNQFGALLLFVREFIRRLSEYFKEQGKQFTVQFPEPIPFHSYFQVIDSHFKARQKLNKTLVTLRNRAHQFRAIQKRLLVRFKDRNPTPLNGMDILFQETHEQLVEMSRTVEDQQDQLRTVSTELSSCTALVCYLIGVKHEMSPEEVQVLESHLTPIVHDNEEHGWEEMVDSAMTHLLRTSLAKNSRESASAPQPLSVPKDTKKLQRHIAIVYDRISKGGKIFTPPPEKKSSKKKPRVAKPNKDPSQ